MQANFYLDVMIQPTGDNTDLQLEHIRNQIFTVLHGCFRQMPMLFALALTSSKTDHVIGLQQQRDKPSSQRRFAVYDVLRIFAEQEQVLQQLLTTLQAHWKVRDYCQLGLVSKVPMHTAWKSYRRFRIPTLKTERNFSYDKAPLRDRRLEQAKAMPFLRVQSQSTGQQFTVIVDIQQAEDAGAGMPDGYGLARASQPFALPYF
ncbi:type I-F CRISPR-associated endoribonuclease Cas6/Csy4 [Alkanindiges sp. WGS2144]|uniref:type I-F CRISPR-associated endoribonuclease Cas6/Csy4 n=1 Tax=Alkanindiges sp. WGS2144 TaxID=3366808 RepID=UPI0037522B60